MSNAIQDTRAARTGQGYDPIHFARLDAIEGRHFWFTARRDLIAHFVRRIGVSLAPGYRVVEIGCGTGNVLSALEAACPTGIVLGVDRFLEGLAFAAARGRKRLVQADAHSTPFRVDFDIVGAFDVIEHLPDDSRILTDMHAMLRGGGHVIITVPASKRLWSEFDEISHHYRRYEKDELELKLRAAGFEDIFVSPFMMSTAPLVWLHRSLLKSRSASASPGNLLEQETRIIPVLNGFLRAVLAVESGLVRRGIQLPFGTSLIAVARKR